MRFKILRKVFRVLYKAMVANLLVMGSIFGNKPIIKNQPGSKEIGREKDD